MSWLQTSPGHQQPWYWLCRYVGPSLTWGRILSTCVISMWSNDIKCKYTGMFMFPLKNLARKGLNAPPALPDIYRSWAAKKSERGPCCKLVELWPWPWPSANGCCQGHHDGCGHWVVWDECSWRGCADFRLADVCARDFGEPSRVLYQSFEAIREGSGLGTGELQKREEGYGVAINSSPPSAAYMHQ